VVDQLAKILLIDDDMDQHALLRVALPAMTVLDCAIDENEALRFIRKNNYDMLIIDINLHETTGFKFLEKLSKESLAADAIKIMLTASELEEDEVTSHKFQVDDFIKKPIRPLVFGALIEKHLKKRILTDVWIKGRLKINLSEMTVQGKATENDSYQEIILTPKEFKILKRLIRHPGQVISREQIFEGVWSEENESYLRSIDTHISALRKKIAEYGAKLSSVRGVGYKIELN
jgi:two-component system response regulator VanR